MIEHLVRGVAGLGSTGKVFAPVLPSDQKGWTQGGANLGSYKSQPLRRRAPPGHRLLSKEECCIAREPFPQLGEYNSSFYP